MDGSRIRWIIVIFLILLVLILGIWGVFSVVRNLFKPRANTTSQTEGSKKALDQYNNVSSSTIMEVQGPVVGDNDYKAYRITIRQSERVFQMIRGYDGMVESEQRFDNNPEAYLVFLKSLDGLGFESKNNYPTNDERGSCPQGRRYIYRIEENGSEKFKAWNTSCKRGVGTSLAPASVRMLFQKQIPDFNKLVSGTGLSY